MNVFESLTDDALKGVLFARAGVLARRLGAWLVITTSALCMSPMVVRAEGFSLFSNTWGDVIVNTDMTAEGRALTPPTPAKPVYFRGKSLGAKLGSISGDTMPDVTQMNRLVAKVLAQQGYLGARPESQEPTLFLVVQWGYLSAGSGDMMWFLGYDAKKDIGAPVLPGMLGPEIYRLHFRSPTVETILDSAKGPIYGIIVTAFDYKSAKTPKPIICWQTRIALPANRKSMAEALPAMVLAAKSTFGNETDSAVLRDTDRVRTGRVDFGDLKFNGFEGEPAKH